jgi:hypothetical protein
MAMRVYAAFLISAGVLTGQTYNNQTLSGNYYFRHLLFSTDAAENITDIRSLWGTIAFNGNGVYSFSGHSGVGSAPPVAASGGGTYSVTAAGVVTLTNPQITTLTLNARWSEISPNEAMLAGSSTEAAANTFDLFIAVQLAPAPSTPSIAGNSYVLSTLAFPAGAASMVRSALIDIQPNGFNGLGNISATGHAANISGGLPTTQSISGGSYTLLSGGTGAANFPVQPGMDAATQLVSGSKLIMYRRRAVSFSVDRAMAACRIF